MRIFLIMDDGIAEMVRAEFCLELSSNRMDCGMIVNIRWASAVYVTASVGSRTAEATLFAVDWNCLIGKELICHALEYQF